MQEISKLGANATVKDGINVYTVTRTEPNADNTTGYRWVRVLHRRSGDFIYSTFTIQGERCYKGGFSTIESAHEWAEAEHERALRTHGVSDSRKERCKQ